MGHFQKKKARHLHLSWKIIEAKILYYSPKDLTEGFISQHMPSDTEFDLMEKEYLSLCNLLKLPNTLVHDTSECSGLPQGATGVTTPMMEVDWTRPSVNLAYRKLLATERGEHINKLQKADG